MIGLEAWAIIAKCFAQLRDYRRAENPKDKGYTDEELKAEVMAFKALKELDERRSEIREPEACEEEFMDWEGNVISRISYAEK